MERLTARTENGHAYLVNVKPDEQDVYIPYKNTLQCILDCFERLAQYEDAEEQGLLVRLPCKVGEYWACDGKRYIVAEITMTNAWGVMVRYYEEGDGEMLSCNPQYFAKHYTREEAEGALQKEAQHE